MSPFCYGREEHALNTIVSTTERSGNVKKELKQTMFEAVSTLRNLFVKLKDSRDGKTIEINQLGGRIGKREAELEQF
jgi:hypothetical protein